MNLFDTDMHRSDFFSPCQNCRYAWFVEISDDEVKQDV